MNRAKIKSKIEGSGGFCRGRNKPSSKTSSPYYTDKVFSSHQASVSVTPSSLRLDAEFSSKVSSGRITFPKAPVLKCGTGVTSVPCWSALAQLSCQRQVEKSPKLSYFAGSCSIGEP